MSKNVRVIPGTEIVERSIQIARIESTNDESRAWGAANDVYLQEIPVKEDWNFLIASSSLVCTAKYADGTVTATTGSTTASFSGATLTAAMDGRRIKFNDNANIYALTFVNSSTGTITPALSGDRNISAGAYVIYKSLYQLAEHFDRFPKDGGLQYWASNNKPTPIPEQALQTYYSEVSTTPGIPTTCRLVGEDTAGMMQVELVPAPDKAYVLPYDFVRALNPLRETTGGTASVAAGGTTVTLHTGSRIADASTGWYVRFDAAGVGSDSEWYRVIALNQTTSAATIQNAYAGAAVNSGAYTLCAAPQYPPMLHYAIIAGAVKRLLSDQKDQTFIYVDSQEAAILNDAKYLFKSRVYGVQPELAMEDYNFRR